MTGLYVASNATALGSQINLQRNMGDLEEIITRLSTGLRINSGKDDPSGLIASELLKSDITATKQAIQNTQRANSVIAIADSALGQISSLLNDIRGLINAAANTGAMTQDQINANQLQVDASLDSIDRIAKTTNYQGQLLLDGSFDFTTQGVDRNMIENLRIDAANFGTDPAADITVDVIEEAKKARLTYDYSALAENTIIEIGGNLGSNVFKFDAGASVESMAKAINALSDSTGVIATVGRDATNGRIVMTSAGINNDISLTAINAGFAAGDYAIKFTAGNSKETRAVINEPTAGQTGVIDFQLQMEEWSTAAGTIDESQIGVNATKFDMISDPSVSIMINTTQGKKIFSVNLIASDSGNNNEFLNGPVAVDLDKNGVLNVEYHANIDGLTPTTLQHIVDAINRSYPEFTATASDPTYVMDHDADSGKVFGTDLRTSNAITIIADHPGEGMNDTDIIYINNTDLQDAMEKADAANEAVAINSPQRASIVLDNGIVAGKQQTITIAALEEGLKYNGTYITLDNTGTTEVKASGMIGDNIVIKYDGTMDLTADLINSAIKQAGLDLQIVNSAGNKAIINPPADFFNTNHVLGQYQGTLEVPDGKVLSGTFGTDGASVVEVDADGKVVGMLGGTKKIASPQQASTTITATGDPAAADQITITAKNTGSQYNGVTFNFAVGSGTEATAKQSGNVITIYSAAGGIDTLSDDFVNKALDTAGLKYTITTNDALVYGKINQGGVDTVLTLGAHDGDTGYAGTTDKNAVVHGTFGLSAAEIPASLSVNDENTVLSVQDMVSYRQLAQRAEVTIFDGENYLTFTGGIATSELNGLSISIKNDPATYTNGRVAVAYNLEDKVLQITGDLANASYATLLQSVQEATGGAVIASVHGDANGVTNLAIGSAKMTAIADATAVSPFVFQIGDRNTALNIAAVGRPKVVGGKTGTDHGAIFFNAQNGLTTANDVVHTINIDSIVGKLVTAENFVDSPGNGLIFINGLDDNEKTRYFSAAMQGGHSGTQTIVTAQDLIDYINSDERLREMFSAELALGNNGTGLLSLFQEVAYYGDPIAETGLQFLGPADSPNIEFRAGKGHENQEMSIQFVNDATGKGEASLTAKNKDAAFSISAASAGMEFDDVAVRFVRLDNNFTSADNFATFESGPTAAVAYCDINTTGNGTDEEIGNFILTANNKGDTYNNVEIMVQLNSAQTQAATATFDPDTKRLIVTVNAIGVSLDQAMAAIEKEGTFTADYDYSYNANPHSDPGMCTFEQLLRTASETSPISIGTTGNTGGHKGGIVTVYMGGNDGEITAQAAIDAINNSVQTKNLFHATNYSGSDGSGQIDIRSDTILPKADSCGTPVPDFKMVTNISGSGVAGESQPTTMIINLATDKDGNSITTSQDLVNFFETLTPEQTRGISVSLLLPPGIPNSGNPCPDPAGRGILQPTGYFDDCDNFISEPIVFVSANTYEVDKQPQGRVVAVNGAAASIDIIAKQAGTAYEGVTLQYQNVIDPNIGPSVIYDAANKIITVNIKEGVTTAAQVKTLIDTSDSTRSLFSVSLVDGTGAGLVTTSDNSVSLSGGTRMEGTPGGASLTGAADADPNKLTLESIHEGSRQVVNVRVVSGRLELKDENGKTAENASGHDMKARINGIDAVSDGRTISLNTSMLNMTMSMNENARAGDSTSFKITGGGATFQIGPDVVSNQQIRIGIQSVNTTRLGGVDGYLYELKKGERADLSTNTRLADLIVQEAITAITTMRGRLGALQKCTLEPNMNGLEDTLEQMSAAEANISNADFAVESSRLTRTQILVQSGAQVLGIANQLPQYAAMLIGQ